MTGTSSTTTPGPGTKPSRCWGHVFSTLSSLGSHQHPAADKDPLSFDHLLTQGNKDIDCSIDSSMTREERIKYALDMASASQLVEKSKLSPFSFIDQRAVDRLTRGSMDLSSRKKDWGNESDRLYDSFLQVANYEELVQLASNGLNVYHSVSPASRKVIQDASKLAAFTPTPHSTAEDQKVWDKFVDYAKTKGFHPMEAMEQDVLTWLEHRAQTTMAPATVQFELACLLK